MRRSGGGVEGRRQWSGEGVDGSWRGLSAGRMPTVGTGRRAPWVSAPPQSKQSVPRRAPCRVGPACPGATRRGGDQVGLAFTAAAELAGELVRVLVGWDNRSFAELGGAGDGLLVTGLISALFCAGQLGSCHGPPPPPPLGHGACVGSGEGQLARGSSRGAPS